MEKKLDILIVEDEASQREMLRGFLQKRGHKVYLAENGPKALQLVRSEYLDVAIIDLKMPGMDGLEVLKEAKKINPELDTIIITAYGTIETAVVAMKLGATDYVTKPVDLRELLILLERIWDKKELMRENQLLREQLKDRQVNQDQIVFASPSMGELINLCGRVAPSRATVLIQGESGTGKELFARLIHRLSPRASRPIITVNCGALPETLIESELFGHEKGAFTGAGQRRMGRFEQADGGTLFLDEVGELSLPVQVKLLRFIQEGEFQRLGSNQSIRSDVRIIAATNKDLLEEVRAGRFREDLYFRLNVILLSIPPLRERKEDIPLLVEHFLGLYSKQNRKPIKGVSQEARSMLLRYDYPGNVRELENIIERAVVISKGDLITTDDLPFKQIGQATATDDGIRSLRDTVETLERKLIERALNEANRNQSKAASSLGISERMLRYKLKKYNLK